MSFWLILILVAGFFMAWNIGANDVANAMGTSVGSGALTLRQAIFVAGILEFAGAFFFGSHVSETIQKGLIHEQIFAETPFVVVQGMLASLIAAGTWLMIASYYGWPVSTTHTIVGAVVGFGAIVGGIEAVEWRNVAFIASSWILSPLLGGILAYFIFQLLRRQLFYKKDPLQAAKKLMPFLVWIFVAILSVILLYNGLRNVHLKLNLASTLAICIGLGAVAALITFCLVKNIASTPLPEKGLSPGLAKAHGDLATVENMFSYLQVMSACLMAFAHGANDVANAIGPLSAAVNILQTGTLTASTTVPTWALGLGGVGIVIGLATWGWRVIETVGKKITELTPTRGFAAEFGAATTILLASRLGMPISTTHTLVGAVLGVGMARGLEALNLSMIRDIVASWLITIPAGAIPTIAIYTFLQLML